MISALWAVLLDLWDFLRGQQPKVSLPSVAEKFTISAARTSVPAVPVRHKHVPLQIEGSKAIVIVDSAECLTRPVYAFDTVLGYFSYGEEVVVSTMQGVFAYVHSARLSGWVSTAALSDDFGLVYVKLQPAFVYGPFHQETIKLRRYINDESLGEKLELSLQPTEFILYTLKRARITVPWPSGRPRLSGDWQILLKGVAGVTISIVPKTGSVLESASNLSAAFLAFVQEVRPDQSLKIVSVGRLDDGEYREEEFTKEQWKEWRPVFISF